MMGKMLPSLLLARVRVEKWEWRTEFVILNANSSRLLRPKIAQRNTLFLEFPCSSFSHSQQFPVSITLVDYATKRFVPLAARTLVWSPANRSGYNNTTEGLLALVKNKWNQVGVNSHFTMTLVHSSCLRRFESTLQYVALKLRFQGKWIMYHLYSAFFWALRSKCLHQCQRV